MELKIYPEKLESIYFLQYEVEFVWNRWPVGRVKLTMRFCLNKITSLWKNSRYSLKSKERIIIIL